MLWYDFKIKVYVCYKLHFYLMHFVLLLQLSSKLRNVISFRFSWCLFERFAAQKVQQKEYFYFKKPRMCNSLIFLPHRNVQLLQNSKKDTPPFYPELISLIIKKIGCVFVFFVINYHFGWRVPHLPIFQLNWIIIFWCAPFGYLYLFSL